MNREQLLNEIAYLRVGIKYAANVSYGIAHPGKDTRVPLYVLQRKLTCLLKRAKYLPTWYIKVRYLWILKQARLI